MLISRRRFAAGVLGSLGTGLLKRAQAFPPPPKLFIFLIAEQFRRIYLDRTLAQLKPGGFRTLMEQSAYYPDCRFAASSFTSCGLATLTTGAYPQLHGIIADRWFDRKSHGLVRARADLLEATTLADELARMGKGRTFCVGLDDRTTSLLAGRSPAQILWLDGNTGQFTTRGNLPDWLADYNRLNPVNNLRGTKWTAVGATPNALPLRTLTFDDKRPGEFIALYKASPFSQKTQFELLLKLLAAEKLGQGNTLDFVFVSLGSMAALGYDTGSDSPLMDQMVLSMDQQLRSAFEALNKVPGGGKYNVIFAVAHGAPAEPAPAERPSMVISGESIARAVNTALSDWIDDGGQKHMYVEKYVYPFLYLKLDALRRQNVAPRGARKLAGEIALRLPGVAGYYTADGDCSHTGDWRRRFENSFNALRSGDVMLSYQPGDVEEFADGRGVSYGSLYNYDTSVPLFLYGAQFRSAEIERTIQATDLAPTIARAAGLSIPSSATGEVLADAFAESKAEK
jgi:hypothetical protein